MKKLDALRHHLIAAVPALTHDPSRLLTFINDGQVEFHRGPNYSHEYRATAQLVVTDYSGEIDALMLPLLYWLSIYEPDLVPAQAVRFEAEIIANDCWDLSLTVTLTERVVARADCATGQILAEHRMPAFDTPDCAPEHWQLYLRNQHAEDEYHLIGEWQTPPGPADD